MDVPVRTCGDWLLERQIGRGSFAVVWKASHRLTRQVVAVKEIATDKLNQKLKESLECEISILKRIDHCNIVRLLDTREVSASHPAAGSEAHTVASVETPTP